ncbi:hypothetical protein [Polaromonas sp.]|uniref:hypothetical protein n=1 Tax=Polaromonas sp. TaxID=1869339 RepID=UPI003BB53B55
MTTSQVSYTHIPDGLYAELDSKTGSIRATIHPFQRDHRICFATCSGAAAHLQGKVIDLPDLQACQQAMTACETELNRGQLVAQSYF